MRKNLIRLGAMAAAGALLLAATTASALPSVDIVWRSTGGSTIGTPGTNASAPVTAAIVLRGDSAGPAILGVFVSIVYDTTELTNVGANPAREEPTVNLPGMGNQFSPLGIGTNEVVLGTITNFDQKTLATGLATDESVTLGSIKFHVLNPVGDNTDIDVIANIDNTGTDTITGPSGANFVGASLTGPAVPEPTTALLVIAGLAGLGYAGRRNLR